MGDATRGDSPGTGDGDGPSSGPLPRSPTVTVVSAVGSTVAGVLPVFLLGALASLIRADLGFTSTGLGLAIGTFYGASALTAVPGGKITEAIGSRRALALGIALSLTSLLGIAFVAESLVQVALFLIPAGASNGVTQQAANVAIARWVPARRQGVSFGLKHSAVSFATLFGGIAVPAIGLTVGWRWAYAGSALATLSLLTILPRETDESRPRRRSERTRGLLSPSERRSLIRIGVAASLAAIGANSMGAFYVESAAASGQPLARAGLFLSLGSVAAIAARFTLGMSADRWRFEQLRAAGFMMMTGTIGLLIFGYAPGTAWLIVGTMIGFAAGWGWPGLLQLAVVRGHLHAPALAGSIVHAGALSGGLMGPIIFGWVVTTYGYPAAWTTASTAAFLGGCLLIWERRGRSGGTPRGGPSHGATGTSRDTREER